MVVPGKYFCFYNTRRILVSDSANCTVLRAVVLTQYRRVTDGQTDRETDGIAVASTALAMRATALANAVRSLFIVNVYTAGALWGMRLNYDANVTSLSLQWMARSIL